MGLTEVFILSMNAGTSSGIPCLIISSLKHTMPFLMSGSLLKASKLSYSLSASIHSCVPLKKKKKNNNDNNNYLILVLKWTMIIITIWSWFSICRIITPVINPYLNLNWTMVWSKQIKSCLYLTHKWSLLIAGIGRNHSHKTLQYKAP